MEILFCVQYIVLGIGFERRCWWIICCHRVYSNSTSRGKYVRLPFLHFFYVPTGVPQYLFASPRDYHGICRIPVIRTCVHLSSLFTVSTDKLTRYTSTRKQSKFTVTIQKLHHNRTIKPNKYSSCNSYRSSGGCR